MRVCSVCACGCVCACACVCEDACVCDPVLSAAATHTPKRVLGVLTRGTRSTQTGYSEYSHRVLGVLTRACAIGCCRPQRRTRTHTRALPPSPTAIRCGAVRRYPVCRSSTGLRSSGRRRRATPSGTSSRSTGPRRTHARARTHTRTHARTHAPTRTHTAHRQHTHTHTHTHTGTHARTHTHARALALALAHLRGKFCKC
jgi:hypothetical protein